MVYSSPLLLIAVTKVVSTGRIATAGDSLVSHFSAEKLPSGNSGTRIVKSGSNCNSLSESLKCFEINSSTVLPSLKISFLINS